MGKEVRFLFHRVALITSTASLPVSRSYASRFYSSLPPLVCICSFTIVSSALPIGSFMAFHLCLYRSARPRLCTRPVGSYHVKRKIGGDELIRLEQRASKLDFERKRTTFPFEILPAVFEK